MARHRHRRTSKRRSSKNIINTTVSVAKTTSKKYMPKVKTGLENVGSKVVNTGKKSVPYLQNVTRKFFGLFGVGKTRRRRRH